MSARAAPSSTSVSSSSRRWAVEVKRRATIGAVDQRTRYLELLNRDSRLALVGGVLAVQSIAPQARTLAEDRGIRCVADDDDELRGMPSSHMRLFRPRPGPRAALTLAASGCTMIGERFTKFLAGRHDARLVPRQRPLTDPQTLADVGPAPEGEAIIEIPEDVLKFYQRNQKEEDR